MIFPHPGCMPTSLHEVAVECIILPELTNHGQKEQQYPTHLHHFMTISINNKVCHLHFCQSIIFQPGKRSKAGGQKSDLDTYFIKV